MGGALLLQHDAGERELPPQGLPWRAVGPATLRVLILALLWRGSLSQLPGFTLTVPQSVSVQEGLCVLVPCTFTYPASYDTDNPSAQLIGTWYKEPATVGQDPPVASSLHSLGMTQETQGRFRLTGDPARGDCSLQISDARRTDAGRYFFSIEKGLLDHTYRSNSDGADPPLTISVPGLMEEPEIQFSPAWGLPGTLLAGEPVNVTCTAPGHCSGPPPRVTWTGPFSDTARDISAQLANGTWARSAALSFTPGLGDHGKELVCSVTYRPPWGPSTNRTVRLHVDCPSLTPNVYTNVGGNVHAAIRDPQPEPRDPDPTDPGSEPQRRGALRAAWMEPAMLASRYQRPSVLGFSFSRPSGSSQSAKTQAWPAKPEGERRALGRDEPKEEDPTRPPKTTDNHIRNGRPDPTAPPNTTGTLTSNGLEAPRIRGLIRAFFEISCKLVFAATGFFLAYYLTLLYYRRHPAALMKAEGRTGRGTGNPRCPSPACRSGHSSATEEPTGN